MNTVPASERRLLVLVVDDISESRRQLCALVAELGHEAVGADSGAAALRLVEERRPDVILLDLLMPEVDGFEVTRRLRALDANRWLPVIVTSSLQGDEHFIHALESGAATGRCSSCSTGWRRSPSVSAGSTTTSSTR
jgi:CheY-like chemotaxis protein